MGNQVEARLAELEREYEIGERRLRNLETEQLHLRETLLRIDGAIQVLRELLPDAIAVANSDQESPADERAEEHRESGAELDGGHVSH